jgi:hypothetical protein
MTEANVPTSRLLIFIVLCVVVGPAIGTLVELCWTMGRIPVLPIARFIGPLLFGGYVIGAPIALVAAVLFVVTARRYNKCGIGTAHLAAVIAAAVVGLVLVIWSLVGHFYDPSALYGIPRMAIVGMVAITGCWYIARVVGILR